MKTAAIKPAYLLCLLCALCPVLSACGMLADNRKLTILFPEPPEHWEGIFSGRTWRLYLPGIMEEPETITLPAGSASGLTISVPKTVPLPVLAFPVFGEMVSDRPAGAIHPFQTGELGDLRLSWEDGCGTVLAGLMIERENSLVYSFNFPRFFEELRVRSGGNPWLLDTEVLVSALSYGGFRADKIRLLPCHDLSISMENPASGQSPPGLPLWTSTNPLESPPFEGRMGILQFKNCSLGLHHYLNTVTRERMTLQIGLEGWKMVLSDQGKTRSGNW